MDRRSTHFDTDEGSEDDQEELSEIASFEDSVVATTTPTATTTTTTTASTTAVVTTVTTSPSSSSSSSSGSSSSHISIIKDSLSDISLGPLSDVNANKTKGFAAAKRISKPIVTLKRKPVPKVTYHPDQAQAATVVGIPEPVRKQEVTREQRALKHLRHRLEAKKGNHVSADEYAIRLPDDDLLAWLRTYNMNVYLVKGKLLHHCHVRMCLDLDNILTNYKPPEILSMHYTCGLCGEDRDQCPVWYELVGILQMDQLVKCSSLKDLIKLKFYHCEMLRQAAKRNNKTQVLVVVDMSEMTRFVLGSGLNIWIKYINILQDHYPYLVKEFIVINKSIMCSEFTLALRPFLNKDTISKVTVLGCNYHQFLLERIDKPNLPALFGGYKCDLDNNPKCLENITWNGKVPSWMLFTDPRLQADVHPLLILGGQRLVLENHVSTLGSTIQWDVFSLSQPVVMSVFVNRISPDTCVIKQRRLSEISTVTRIAAIFSKTGGRYLTVLDNCKHFDQAARGKYRITVVPPDWLTVKLKPQRPLGDEFDMSEPIGKYERKILEWKNQQEPNYKWMKLPSLGKA